MCGGHHSEVGELTQGTPTSVRTPGLHAGKVDVEVRRSGLYSGGTWQGLGVNPQILGKRKSPEALAGNTASSFCEASGAAPPWGSCSWQLLQFGLYSGNF